MIVSKQCWSVCCPRAHRLNPDPCKGGGWYGSPEDRCPRCGSAVIVTGSWWETPLEPEQKETAKT